MIYDESKNIDIMDLVIPKFSDNNFNHQEIKAYMELHKSNCNYFVYERFESEVFMINSLIKSLMFDFGGDVLRLLKKSNYENIEDLVDIDENNDTVVIDAIAKFFPEDTTKLKNIKSFMNAHKSVCNHFLNRCYEKELSFIDKLSTKITSDLGFEVTRLIHKDDYIKAKDFDNE